MTIDPKDIKILLVEDATTMRKLELKSLKSLGFENIIEAGNGEEALEKLQQEPGINFIISDWNMPKMGGYEVLTWVRASEKFKDIPFLMATGQGELRQEKKAIEAGVSSFVAKPFNSEELKNKIDEAFGTKKTEEFSDIHARHHASSSSGKVRLKIAHIQITDHLVAGVIEHLIDKGIVAPRYFDVELQRMKGWNLVREALAKGTVDAACVLAPIAMDLFSMGVPIKLIILTHKNGSIFVRNKQGLYVEPYQNFFKGKSFYIPHTLSVHHMLCHMFFKRIGLNSGVMGEKGIDVNFEVIDPILMPEFLNANPESGGFMVAEPLGTKAIASGIAELQFLSGELWEQHPCCVIAIRNEIIEKYPDAVYEFTDTVVQAGRFIEKKPETAAEIAVGFLDPDKKLGLKVPLLKNVLKESRGIKCGDLYPAIEDLDKIQRYMHKSMGIGTLIDLEKFVDIRFADAASADRTIKQKVSMLHEETNLAIEILHRGSTEAKKTSKSMLNKEGKYLTFALGEQEFGIDILKIREIIGMVPIRSVPQTPPHIKGVINLRGKVIPVMDLRLRFSMDEHPYNDRTCIVVMEHSAENKNMLMGIVVDSVSEVLSMKAADIEDTPYFGMGTDTKHILAIAKLDTGVKILLDIDHVLSGEGKIIMENLFD